MKKIILAAVIITLAVIRFRTILISEITSVFRSGYKQKNNQIFCYDSVPEYNGDIYIEINNDVPFFNDECKPEYKMIYSELDELGRSGAAELVISRRELPNETRSDIGYIRPSGWNQNKYPGIINSDPAFIYNRSHILMWYLCGNQSNRPELLLTGTRDFNIEGMLPNEKLLLDYIMNNDGYIRYRVTPVYENDNLLASGVLIEAESVEDNGKNFHICRWVYNVQDGIDIDYKTGRNTVLE